LAGAEEFARLARRLKDAGETGLRRELGNAINDAVKPFGATVSAAPYLRSYMPDHYADVLAGDLSVRATKRASATAYGVAIRVAGRLRNRQVERLNAGILRHPVFERRGTERHDWDWVDQADGMKPGFFTDATKAAAPEIRAEVLGAVRDVAQKIAHG
jgi:hypothetical protein